MFSLSLRSVERVFGIFHHKVGRVTPLCPGERGAGIF